MSKADSQNFDAVIQKEGKFTFVEIPFLPREVWGAQPRYHVTGTINGLAVSGTLGALGQAFFLRLSAKWIGQSGIEIGEQVNVQLSLEARQTQSLP